MFQKAPQREALGRGLGSIFQMSKAANDQQSSIIFCSLSKVIPSEIQPRKYFDEASLEELSRSIHEKGLLQPILVRPHPGKTDHYQIIAGERRWRAAQRAGLDEIPIVVKQTDEQEVMELALIENLQRENLNPIEESRAFQELIERYSYTHEELAQKLGKSRPVVANALRLLRLPEEVCQFLMEGRLSTGHARALVILEDPAKQIELSRRIIDEGLNVRQTESLVKRLKSLSQNPTASSAKSAPISPHSNWLEDRFRQYLGTKVSLQQNNGKGKLVIEFFSKEDLDRIYQLILKPTHSEEPSYV